MASGISWIDDVRIGPHAVEACGIVWADYCYSPPSRRAHVTLIGWSDTDRRFPTLAAMIARVRAVHARQVAEVAAMPAAYHARHAWHTTREYAVSSVTAFACDAIALLAAWAAADAESR